MHECVHRKLVYLYISPTGPTTDIKLWTENTLWSEHKICHYIHQRILGSFLLTLQYYGIWLNTSELEIIQIDMCSETRFSLLGYLVSLLNNCYLKKQFDQLNWSFA